MNLALLTDYSLRILLFLAARPHRAQVGQVAEFYRISKDHVAKAVNRLAHLGYVRTVRGVRGGVELAREPHEISLGQVIVELEGRLKLLDCVAVENVCVIQPTCQLRHVLAEAERLQTDYLRGIRLSDLVPRSGNLVALALPLEPVGSAAVSNPSAN